MEKVKTDLDPNIQAYRLSIVDGYIAAYGTGLLIFMDDETYDGSSRIN